MYLIAAYYNFVNFLGFTCIIDIAKHQKNPAYYVFQFSINSPLVPLSTKSALKTVFITESIHTFAGNR